MILTTPTDREITIVRELAAPPDVVFDAHTRPELLRRWFGPHGWLLVACEIDLRPGGRYRHTMRGPAGEQMTLHGTYLAVDRPSRLVSAEHNPDCSARADHESVVTLTFAERDGRTLLTNTARFPTREIRDAVLASGMARGVAEGHDRLTDLLTDALEETR